MRLLAAFLLATVLILTTAGCTEDEKPREPVLTGELVAGGTYDPASYKGKVTVVNFWGSWCNPCRAEMPGLVKAYDDLKDEDVVFLGINVQDAESNALDFLAELDVTYDQVRDPMAEYFTAVGGFGMPTTLLVDADGRIVYRHTGAIEADQLDDLLVDQLDVRT